MSEITERLRFFSTKKDGEVNISRCPSSALVEAAYHIEAQEARIAELERVNEYVLNALRYDPADARFMTGVSIGSIRSALSKPQTQ